MIIDSFEFCTACHTVEDRRSDIVPPTRSAILACRRRRRCCDAAGSLPLADRRRFPPEAIATGLAGQEVGEGSVGRAIREVLPQFR
jgi:hypothetical protein